MQINSVQQPTAFKGYLKFRYGRYINTRNIKTVLYDDTNIDKSTLQDDMQNHNMYYPGNGE